jgi:predicted DNA-binding transcriptional regulator AlpA
MFNFKSREELEAAIGTQSFPQPLRIDGSNVPIWGSRHIREFCEGLEQAAKAAAAAELRVPEGYSTTSDLVKLLGVSRQTIHNYYKSGKIPRARRFGGKPAWSPEQMHKILVAMGEEE